MDENEGISLSEICRLIFKKIWFVVIVSIALGVIVAGAFFIKNKGSTKYEFSFNLSSPEIIIGSLKKPDGSAFNYKDIISKENIETVAKTSDFSNINTDKLSENISIKAVLNPLIENETKNIEIKPQYLYNLTVTANANYFANEKQAKNFFKDLSELQVKKIIQNVEEYNYFQTEELYEKTPSYSYKLSYASEERNYLLDLINSFAENYNDQITNLTFSNLKNQLQSKDLIKKINDLSTQLNVNGYYKVTDDAGKVIENLIDSINKSFNNIYYYNFEINNLKENVEAINVGSSTNIDGNAVYTKIIEYNTSITQERKNIDLALKNIKYVDSFKGQETTISNSIKNNYKKYFNEDFDINTIASNIQYDKDKEETFSKDLNSLKGEFSNLAKEFKNTILKLYQGNTYVQYNEINTIGHTSLILGGIVGVVVGFICSAVVVFVIENNKEKKLANTEKNN